ncbi:MAG: cation diffusion facilitator family transporter [Acidimicrobiales bacterium]|jgi:cation diffusion facilitator family transporter
MPEDTEDETKKIGVITALAVNCIEVAGLGIAAWITGSTALRAETAVNVAEVLVVVFLLLGVLKSAREPDERHPLGHGRERFFWSLFAALGLFFGGGGLAIDEAVQSAFHPTHVQSYALAYIVLASTAVLDAYSLVIGLRPFLDQASRRNFSPREYLRRSTDPASVTVIVAGSCAVLGAIVAAAGLLATQLSKSSTPDTIASAVIGLLLIAASGFLLQINRDLIGGRGVSPATLRAMRSVVASQAGVKEVSDLFAVVVGPMSLVVDGNVIFQDDLSVAVVEQTIERTNEELRKRWPMIQHIYLTPVPAQPRLTPRSAARK